jgi:hypothetical protein
MLIRSQDKTKITTSLDLDVYSPPYSNEYKINAGNVGYIGTYSTKEKAIKVLDMICKHAEGLHFSTIIPNECGMIYGNVFNMPQDSEV